MPEHNHIHQRPHTKKDKYEWDQYQFGPELNLLAAVLELHEEWHFIKGVSGGERLMK